MDITAIDIIIIFCSGCWTAVFIQAIIYLIHGTKKGKE